MQGRGQPAKRDGKNGWDLQHDRAVCEVANEGEEHMDCLDWSNHSGDYYDLGSDNSDSEFYNTTDEEDGVSFRV